MKIFLMNLCLIWTPLMYSHGGRLDKEGCHRKKRVKHCHGKNLKKVPPCNWTAYIVPKASGYKTCTINPSKSNPYSWESCGKIKGAPLWVTIPPPAAPRVKKKNYIGCERIELNDAVKVARPIARKLMMGRNAGSRSNILNHATRRGVMAQRTPLGGGKEGIYIPKVLLTEFIANLYERDKRRHPENRIMK